MLCVRVKRGLGAANELMYLGVVMVTQAKCAGRPFPGLSVFLAQTA